MSYQSFKRNDLFYNQIKTYPQQKFFIYDRKVYYNNTLALSGAFIDNIVTDSPGYISLDELNIDRPVGQRIHPFIIKGAESEGFRTISVDDFQTNFNFGDILSSSYPLTASISRDRFATGQSRPHISALQNVLNNYKVLSPHYSYNSGLGNKSSQELSLISIPSIFYGSSIKKGSIDCKFYVSGSLIGRLQDTLQNGNLIQVEPSGSVGSGSIAGVALYNEGFLILTGAWNITNAHTEPYIIGQPSQSPRWIDFGSTGSSGASENLPSSSFSLNFEGINYINTLTMLCHARTAELNFSSNPTYTEYGQSTSAITNSIHFIEPDNIKIKNIVHKNYDDPTGSFEKITYISTINIYDELKNVIGIAKLARPVRKREMDSYTFKLKLDI